MGAKHPASGIARKIVKAACPHDCPDTCGMHISVENGVAVKVEGAKDMPFTQGTLCTKVARYLDRTYSKERVLHPLKRVGRKRPAVKDVQRPMSELRAQSTDPEEPAAEPELVG